MKFRLPPGPVGGLNPAGPRGGDRARVGGDRSLGVDRAESRSRFASCVGGGDRSRDIGGERGLDACCTAPNRLGWTGGDERRELVPDVLADVRSESRGRGEGERRL